ncbi:hypothetical protein LY78DRAFT_391494 [Colletotrichum sublineola]|nr:hypothetical protein LY78DRAFT_391494 [Colletotrichum sublineola]
MNASNIPGSDGPWLTTSEREPKCAMPFACVTLRTTAPPGGRLGAWPVGIVPVNKAGTCLFAGLQGLFEDEAGIVPLPCRVVPLRAVRDASTCQVPLRSGIHRHEGAAVSNTKGRQRADTYLRLVAPSLYVRREGTGLAWWELAGRRGGKHSIFARIRPRLPWPGDSRDAATRICCGLSNVSGPGSPRGRHGQRDWNQECTR